MKIALVHRNFPGQFRHLAPELTRQGHQVVALTWAGNQNPRTHPTIEYQNKSMPGADPGDFFALNVHRGQQAAAAAAQYSQKTGFTPDLVVGSINWGETLFLREIWPNARHVGYAEFYYGARERDTDFDPEFYRPSLERDTRVTARNAHLLMAATRADALLSPTQWQASTFPSDVRHKISVVHDGVDTDKLRPDPLAKFTLPNGRILTQKDQVLTFINRNLEPYRGFHTLMRALPKVMAAHPKLQVVMVGGEDRGYGPIPSATQSWKQRLLAEVGGQLDQSRLHFTGRVPYHQMVSMLQISSVHAYLSYPFVLSWSMLEAMSLGCVIIGSDTPPVAEAITDGQNGYLVDFFDVAAWSDKISDVLASTDNHTQMRKAARAHAKANYDLKSVCMPNLLKFLELRDA
jgi:glycosyltransferase involved in cell wall biosynthesis